MYVLKCQVVKYSVLILYTWDLFPWILIKNGWIIVRLLAVFYKINLKTHFLLQIIKISNCCKFFKLKKLLTLTIQLLEVLFNEILYF